MTRPKDQEREIRSIAEARLSEYKGRVPEEEFERIVSVAMEGIARDMGLYASGTAKTWSNLVEVRTPQDLEALEGAPDPPPHVVILLQDTALVSGGLLRLGRSGKLYSIFFLELNSVVKSIARDLDNIPVFVVRDLGEVLSTVEGLQVSPHHAIATAINADQVELRYIEGSPS